MSEQEYIRIIRSTFDNLNGHNLDANDPYTHESIKVYVTGISTSMDRSEGKLYTSRFLDAFPDLHFDLKDIFAQGNKVAVTWVARGTHKNPLLTATGDRIPATQRSTSVPGCSVYEFRDNKIVRQEIFWDQLPFLMQLGLLTEQSLTSRSTR